MRPDLHDCVLERVVVALPVVPVDAVPKALVLPPQVEAVQVGVVAGRVPPGTGKPEFKEVRRLKKVLT